MAQTKQDCEKLHALKNCPNCGMEKQESVGSSFQGMTIIFLSCKHCGWEASYKWPEGRK